MMIGEVGLTPDEYFRLTRGETIAKANGLQINREMESVNFRRLYTLMYNQNAKKGRGKREDKLWPLGIDDYKKGKLTEAEKQRRKNIASHGID